MRSRLLVLVALVGTALVGAACGAAGSAAPQTFSNVTFDTVQVFAMSGIASYYPSALAIFTRQVVPTVIFSDGTVAFDIAFDLTPGGSVRILPPRSVVIGPNLAPEQVGLLPQPGVAFDAIQTAPLTGFTLDSTVTIPPGQPLLIQTNTVFCSSFVPPQQYAKLIVDSVNTVSRLIYFRLATNPNCGRRNLAVGSQ
jgi:hypothetical protein